MATVARSPVLAVLAIALAVAALSCGTCPPVPSVTSLSPASATAGGSQFLLTVNGDDFRHDSVVLPDRCRCVRHGPPQKPPGKGCLPNWW
jgi:hypothetical protein